MNLHLRYPKGYVGQATAPPVPILLAGIMNCSCGDITSSSRFQTSRNSPHSGLVENFEPSDQVRYYIQAMIVRKVHDNEELRIISRHDRPL